MSADVGSSELLLAENVSCVHDRERCDAQPVVSRRKEGVAEMTLTQAMAKFMQRDRLEVDPAVAGLVIRVDFPQEAVIEINFAEGCVAHSIVVDIGWISGAIDKDEREGHAQDV